MRQVVLHFLNLPTGFKYLNVALSVYEGFEIVDSCRLSSLI